MANSVIYNKFRHTNLQRFMSSLIGDSNPLYLGIGRPYYWNTTLGNDTVVGTSVNSQRNETLDWNDMMFMKRINYSDVAYGIPKTLWEAGNCYDQYRIDWDSNAASTSIYDDGPISDISTSHSIVVNYQNDVYVCLKHPYPTDPSNPFTTVPVSTQSPELGIPIGSATGILKTADGYYWKFIANTSAAMVVSFSAHTLVSNTSTTFHPVTTLSANPGVSDPMYDQWISQSTTSYNHRGGIYAVNVLGSGSGYNSGNAGVRSVVSCTTDDHLRIIGDGNGMQYNVVYGSGGSITDIEITDPGQGYSYATVTAYGGIGFSCEIIYSPGSGLGCEPSKDLDSVYLLLAATLASTDATLTTANDFRKVHLISAPRTWGSWSSPATASIVDNTYRMVLTGSSGDFVVDDIVDITTTTSYVIKARVVDWDSSGHVLRVIRTDSENYNNIGAAYPISIGHTVSGTLAASGIIGTLYNPDIQPYSGDVIYSEYRNPLMRATDQTEAIRVIIQF